MQKIEAQKLLLPIDGSKRSFETVRHFAAMKPFQRHKVVLFHVFNGVPECYFDIAKEPKSIKTAIHVKAWEIEQRKNIEATMEKARRILIQAGFNKESVRVSIQNRKRGIARDIVHEAHDRYAAVIIRRRGSGAIRSLVLGSVATKLIESITFAPLLIMGKEKMTGRILVAMDSSDGAMRALDFVAAQLGGYDYDVRLLHVIRGNGDIARKRPDLRNPQESRQLAKDQIKTAFNKARKHLIAGGFSDNQISEKIVTSAVSRAAAIAEIAKKEGFGTIVIGRTGVSRPRGFFIGRVANKAIHVARRFSVWVIN
jgi:nucleotide-binding universal stress UspA family protein